MGIFRNILLISSLLVSNMLYAEDATITSMGKHTDILGSSIDFLLFKGGDYGDGLAGISMRDKNGFDKVMVMTQDENTLIEIIGYMKKLTLGLNPAVDIDGGAVQAGRQQCINNPASCGIELADSNGSTQAGIEQCKNDPTSCGIELADSNGSTQAGVEQCKNDPVSCGIELADSAGNSDCMASYSSAGELHAPCVSVSDPLGSTTIYDLTMIQQAGSFTFDLDMSSIKPH